MPKIEVFPSGDFNQTLAELANDHRENQIEDGFVLWVRDRQINFNWFGKDSCVKMLGLLEYAKEQVQQYIRENG